MAFQSFEKPTNNLFQSTSLIEKPKAPLYQYPMKNMPSPTAAANKNTYKVKVIQKGIQTLPRQGFFSTLASTALKLRYVQSVQAPQMIIMAMHSMPQGSAIAARVLSLPV